MARQQQASPFVIKPWPIRLEETISDALYHTRTGSSGEGNYELPKPGEVRYENSVVGRGQYKNVRCNGECYFRWGVNRNGSTISRSYIARKAANQAVTADAAGTVNTFTDTGQFTANEEVDNILYILDNADSAGAAPEGEWAVIVANDANTLTLQSAYASASALTAATASGDTGVIVSVAKLTLLGGAIEREETFGVALADVADNYWGWFCCKGQVETAIVAVGTTVTPAGSGLIGAAGGVLTNSSGSGQDIMLARSMSVYTTDTVRRTVPVFFDVIHGTPFTSA